MPGDVVSLAAAMTPYVTKAVEAYGGAVLAKVGDDTADATVGLGRRLLQRMFGTRAGGEQLPGPLKYLVANPQDSDAMAALRLQIRDALSEDPDLEAEVRHMLARDKVTVTASGKRSIAAQVISGVAATGDNPDIRQ